MFRKIITYHTKLKKHKAYRIATNIYTIAIVSFIIFISFLSNHNLLNQYRLKKILREAEAEKQFYLREIERNKNAIYLLGNDPEYIERFAREEYLMKRDNEDIFIFIEN